MNIEKDIEIIRDRLNTENISPRPSYEDAHAALQRVRRAFAVLFAGVEALQPSMLSSKTPSEIAEETEEAEREFNRPPEIRRHIGLLAALDEIARVSRRDFR